MHISRLLAELHAAAPVVEPSLLAADFANLQREVERLEAAGARVLHLDVMDGHFVPNISFGIPVVQAVRRVTRLALDVHLMISEPARYLEPFREAGADMISFHIEVVPDAAPLLKKARGLGMAAGIVLNPLTPVSALDGCLSACDYVLVMSVMPGFGGQEFEREALAKVRHLRERAPSALISIDGGVNGHTIGACSEAGADLFVVGTGLLSHSDYTQRMAELTAAARAAAGVRA
jgi:ribulose-phosphate 3-epimerase